VAFAVITAVFGPDARRGITALTLVAGFASTIFMPLTQLLIGALGWRNALLVLGALNLVVCLPLHAIFVPGTTGSHVPEIPQGDAPAASELRAILRGRVFVGLAIWFTAYNAAQSAFIFQFVPLLTTWGVETAAILTSVAIIGPMQVVGRIILMCFSTRLETREIGMAVTVLLPASVLALLFLPHTLLSLGLVATLYGAGNGIMTIVRGIAVSDLIGRTHYGAMNGALTVPTNVAKALAPFVAAALWSAMGNPALMLWSILGCALLGTVGFVLALSGPPLAA
jgi:predicted MFS family arabinose efflux permease